MQLKVPIAVLSARAALVDQIYVGFGLDCSLDTMHAQARRASSVNPTQVARPALCWAERHGTQHEVWTAISP